jgi:hypothetical protein
MPILRSLLLLIALLSPAFAGDGPQGAASAKEAVQVLQVYLDGVAKDGGRPDYTKPPASELFQKVFDLAQLSALPPSTSADVGWLVQWFTAASLANKQIVYFGTKASPDPDEMDVLRNLKEYESQYAQAMNFMIRVAARESRALDLFMETLTPEQRTPVREAGLLKARSGAAELLASAIGIVAQGVGPDNARLMSAALKDTRDVWASYLLPDDRKQILGYLAKATEIVTDAGVKADLMAVGGTFSAVK